MQEFTFDSNRFNEVRNKAIFHTVLKFIVFISAAFGFSFKSIANGTYGAIDVCMLILILIALLYVILGSEWDRKYYKAMKLIIDDIGITQIMPGKDTLVLPFADITKVERYNGSLFIYSETSKLEVLPQMNNYEGIVDKIALYIPISEPSFIDKLYYVLVGKY
jgi:hypothetical protein